MKEKLRFKLSGEMLIGRVSKETSSLREDRTSMIGIVLSLIFLLLTLAIILLKRKLIPPEIPLFYNRPWGLQLVPSVWLWIILLIDFLILAVNSYLAARISREEKLLSQILIWTSTLFSALLTITIYKIITIII